MPVIMDVQQSYCNVLIFLFTCSVRWIPLRRGRTPKDQSDLFHQKPVTVIAKAITTTMKAATKAKKSSHSVIIEEMNDVENLVSQSLVSKKNHCGRYKNWNLPGNIKVLLEELNIMGGGNEANIVRTHRVPRSILYDARKQLKVANPNNKNLVGTATKEMLRPTCPSPKSLATLSERDELQGIACFRDKNNNGMTRKEMILLVMDFTGCCKWKQAENHLDFLIHACW